MPDRKIEKVCEECGESDWTKHVKSARYCSRRRSGLAQRREDISYGGAHRRVYVARGKATDHACVDCGEQAAEWSYDGLDPDELVGENGRSGYSASYSLKPEHYVPRWVAHQVAHDAENGARSKRGETGSAAKLSDAQRRGVLASVLRHGSPDAREYAERLDVSPSLIRKIRQGKHSPT